MLMTVTVLWVVGFVVLIFTTIFGLIESRRVSNIVLGAGNFGVGLNGESNKSILFLKWLIRTDLKLIEDLSMRKRVARLKKIFWFHSLVFLIVVLCQVILVSSK